MFRCVLAAGALAHLAHAAIPLVSTNADWRFLPGTAEASAPDPTAWRAVGFPDASWTLSPATFHYGESGFSGTTVAGMQNNYTSFFLRRTFQVTHAPSVESLTLRAACDDGFIAWINGTRIASQSAPAEPFTVAALASGNAAEPVLFSDYLVTAPTAFLQTGENVLAVQVFNVSAGSSDIVFDAELTAELRPDAPLTVLAVDPPPGLVTNLDHVRVTFSEPVTGVGAEDFLLNGTPAWGISGSGDTYNFNFAPLTYGPVLISWAPNHGIVTAALPLRPLLSATPGVTWNYEYVDPLAPLLRSVHPAPGTTIRWLSEVTVLFDKAVEGVDAADLLIAGQPATNLTGVGAGPYVFQFPDRPAGTTALAWAADHGIQSVSALPRAFIGVGWSNVVDPQWQPGRVVLSEFMAQNLTGLKDEGGDPSDWLELQNLDDQPVKLEGWSLSNDPRQPGLWVFPDVTIPAHGYLVVFASGKDLTNTAAGARLHTNFKLGVAGGFLGLYPPDSPRTAADAFDPQFPEQRPDYAYGRSGPAEWRYFQTATPGAANGISTIDGLTAPVHVSAPRGFYPASFPLTLSCATPGALIRYTLDGSLPTETQGLVYTEPLLIDRTRVLRVAAFKKHLLPSVATTHTYLFNLPVARRLLPTLSIVTASNNLYGATGIMEYSPRNTTKHGLAWERLSSVELIRPEDNGGFQVDCGLRVAGGDYIRGLYNYRSTTPPQGKYSFRLYFRAEYGTGRLRYPLFDRTTVESFDRITLRAGMNDSTNPFLLDELVRQLVSDTGQAAAHGTFVNLFLNGVYKGYYNPTEHYNESFLQDYHSGGEDWDIVAQNAEVHEGTSAAWNALRTYVNSQDLTNAANYLAVDRQLDLTNFVDYLLPLCYADVDDWPHNNWRAARERVAGARFRFYPWDAEFSFGFQGTSLTRNTIASQLSSLSPPWGSTEIQRLFNGLKRLPEFKLLFADRVHRHLFNGGALTDERIRQRYEQLRGNLTGTISGFNNTIGTSWIPNRRRYYLSHLATAGFLASSNAPVWNQFGGRVPDGFPLTMTCTNGTIYYTTNGADPRVAFTGAVSTNALQYRAPVPLHTSLLVRARTLDGTNWSAVTEASFQVESLGPSLALSEIMYHPAGGEAYEFLEVQSLAQIPLDLRDYSLTQDGDPIFRFPVGFPPLPAGARLVLASQVNPAAFAARYPDVAIAGFFSGNLDNGGATLALLDRNGRTVCSVTYQDALPWPESADGDGPSLELLDPTGDPDDPANWEASSSTLGSPGLGHPQPPPPTVRINEVLAWNVAATLLDGAHPDWVELHNAGSTPVNLDNWTLLDADSGTGCTLPAGTTLAPQGFLVLWCDRLTNAPGLHAPFALDATRQTLVLLNAASQRVDVLTTGPQVPDFSVGRLQPDAHWALTEPTPGAPNEPALLAPAAALGLNEFLANPAPGEDDWIEIHNRNSARPAALDGLYFTTSNALFRCRALGFVPPAGFVTLRADANPGPNHLDLTLPRTGGMITLSDPAGLELERLTYSTQAEGVSAGRFPDGSTNTYATFPGTPSPGASNYFAGWTGPVLNELLARNQRATTNALGRVADWIELYNPLLTTVDLSGFRLTRTGSDAETWTLPVGTSIPALGYLVIACDADLPPSTNSAPLLNTGFNLPRAGDRLSLLAPSGQVADVVAYGQQLADQSIGRRNGVWTLLTAPTPGGVNGPAATFADPRRVLLNEWSAGPDDAEDWVELFNPEALPVDLGDFTLTDDLSVAGLTNHTLPPLTFLAPGGFGLWVADGQTERGFDHLPFRFDDQGEYVRLYDPARLAVDTIAFGAQQVGASEGRWPDGSTNRVRFVDSPSPGESNYLPLRSLRIHELLTHTDPPYEDAIELFNPTDRPVAVGGWFLGSDPEQLRQYQIPEGTVVAPGAFLTLFEYQFNATPGVPPGFELDSAHGGRLYLSAAEADGRLSGYRDVVDYGAAPNGIPFGRLNTSLGLDLAALLEPTFGPQPPTTLAQFRQGTGRTNAPVRIGPVVLSEILYRPVIGPATNRSDAPDLEFVELHNASDSTVLLYDTAHATNAWRLDGGVRFTFPPGASMPPLSTLVVVRFDPVLDPARRLEFLAAFGLPESTPLTGPFDGQLDNRGERIALVRPDTPQAAGQPDAGFVPSLEVDAVRYGNAGAWPAAADGTGHSLQRLAPSLYGNEPLHWQAATPTPGTVPATAGQTDADLDGLPDAWETDHGLDPRFAPDALLDADGDGCSNLAEFIAGTDPNDPEDLLALTVIATADEFLLRFLTSPQRSYTVEFTDDPARGIWYKLLDVPAAPDQRLHEVSLYRLGQPSPRYFRIVTPARL